MEASKGLSALKKAIRSINARFRRLKDQDGPLADRLRAKKDALIDAMAAGCPGHRFIAMRGRKASATRPAVPALRLCERCGHCERVEAGGPRPSGRVQVLPLEEYALRQGAILKKLGINV